MGEYSRTIGEMGENISEYFFDLIGWRGLSNSEFSCLEKRKHDCNKHGLDFFSVYECPLENDTLETVFISVKYNKPDNIKSNFIKFGETLTKSSVCFQYDERYKSAITAFNYKKKRVSHLIVWLNHNEDEGYSLIKSLSSVNQDLSFNFDSLYLIDNQRVNFITTSLNFVNSTFGNASIEFVYPSTGLNERIDGGRILSGKILPLHLLNSSILPIKVIDGNLQKHLMLFVNESFDEESLKRTMGLSQNLTGGWCHKIIICFPDYQASKHDGVRELVFLRFTKNQFSDMVEVKSFNNTFKSSEKPIKNISKSDYEYDSQLNMETMLPFGDQMRQLLVQSFIYKPDLQTLLNRRGVFIGKNSEKVDVIPLLTKTLISASEFEFLRRKQSSKEGAEKISNQNFNVKIGAEINETLKNINLERVNSYIGNQLPNCELINSIDSKLENNGTFRFQYQLKRHDLTKDWANTKSVHTGEVLIKMKNGDNGLGKIQVDSVYTTSETKAINKQIIKAFENGLKDDGIIPKDEVFQKMIANEFSNVSKNMFLLSFMETSDHDSIRFKTLTSIDFSLDEEHSKKLPEDLASMKDRLDESIFKGKNLQDIHYIKDKTYREMFDFHSLTSDFIFQFNDFKGIFQVEYGFLDAKGKNKLEAGEAEFEFKILDINPFLERNLTTKENHELRLYLKEEFNKLRIQKSQKIERKIGQQLSFLEISN